MLLIALLIYLHTACIVFKFYRKKITINDKKEKNEHALDNWFILTLCHTAVKDSYTVQGVALPEVGCPFTEVV